MIDLDALTAWTGRIRRQANDGLMSAGLLAALRRDLPAIDPPTIVGTVDALVAEDRELRDLLGRAATTIAWDHTPPSVPNDGECHGCDLLGEIVDLLGLDPDRLI